MSAHPISPYERGLVLSGQGRHLEAISQFEEALRFEPEDPRVMFALGHTAQAMGHLGPAAEFYRRVLARDPARLEAIVNLANLLRAQGQHRAALALLAPALARRGDAPELWLTIGSTWREMGEPAHAEVHYREALNRAPTFAPALANLADLMADKGDTVQALDLYERALVAEPLNAQVRLNRAILHLLEGRLIEGWSDYSARLNVANKVPVCDHGLSRWNGRSIKNLLVSAEQGVGDQVMFASMLGDLDSRVSQLFVECDPRLVTLFRRSFPSARVHSWDVETKNGQTLTHHDWLKEGDADAAIELGSLGGILRTTIDAFPTPHAYLVPDAAEGACWRAVLAKTGSAPFIGICWRSGSKQGHRTLQYASLEAWARFVRSAPGTLVSVQYDARDDEIAALEHMSGRQIFVPHGLDQKTELDRTAALLSALDAVVTAPTAVSWLASALGVATYKIVYDTSWTCFGQDFEPFAPSCRIMRPNTPGDFSNAFDQALSLLGR